MHILSAHCFREGVLIPGPRKLPKELTLDMVNLMAQSFWEGDVLESYTRKMLKIILSEYIYIHNKTRTVYHESINHTLIYFLP